MSTARPGTEPKSGTTFDVIVVGGGHAGAEAAVAAARVGARVALVTSAIETIGQMSCNPAIGGVAKGTVVREIDALGGVMGRATDAASIQFRMLNRGKGPAVWAPRSQCDRGLYRRAVRRILDEHDGVTVLQGTVRALRFGKDEQTVRGIETLEGRFIEATVVVLTTGTFLRGRIHIGVDTSVAGGRAGEAAATHLAEQLAALGLQVARFKTGTPPRIDGRTVNFDVLERQDSELEQFQYRWSAWTGARHSSTALGAGTTPPFIPLEQLPCWIAYAGAETKELVARHIAQSAMYGGAIGARGPRYCPSIEDKIVRFPAAARHQLFLEPEGLETSELYVNGLSTSLPVDLQLDMLRSVKGLEGAVMTRAGYAIEYDYSPPQQLWPWLEVRALPGLFFAGQINGTTGYEEAAAQGVVAGVNAALRALERDPVTLGRESSYLGVLVDDLVTRGVDEPYRLFTSRSEFRLTVRQDNAVKRLHELGRTLGMYSADELRVIDARLEQEHQLLRLAEKTTVDPPAVEQLLLDSGSAPLAHGVRISELAKRHGVSLQALFAIAGLTEATWVDALASVELELKYAGYFVRERAAAERLKQLATYPIPADAPFGSMRTLSVESRQKLASRQPSSLAQAASIPGVSPADLQNLLLELERSRA